MNSYRTIYTVDGEEATRTFFIQRDTFAEATADTDSILREETGAMLCIHATMEEATADTDPGDPPGGSRVARI